MNNIKVICICSWEEETGKTLISKSLFKYFSSVNKKVIYVDFNENNDFFKLFSITPGKFSREFEGHKIAKVDNEACIHCGICKENCKYDAIIMRNLYFAINSDRCEGCGECEVVCPVDAITLSVIGRGRVDIYQCQEGVLLKTTSFAGEIDLHLLKFTILTAKELIEENQDGIIIINSLVDNNEKLKFFSKNTDLMLILFYKPGVDDFINGEKLIERYDDIPILFLINRLSDQESNTSTYVDFIPEELVFGLKEFKHIDSNKKIDLIVQEFKNNGLIEKMIFKMNNFIRITEDYQH